MFFDEISSLWSKTHFFFILNIIIINIYIVYEKKWVFDQRVFWANFMATDVNCYGRELYMRDIYKDLYER